MGFFYGPGECNHQDPFLQTFDGSKGQPLDLLLYKCCLRHLMKALSQLNEQQSPLLIPASHFIIQKEKCIKSISIK